MNRKQFLLLLLVLISTRQLAAQQTDIKDSLMSMIAKAKEDSAGVDLYLKAGMLVAHSNAEQSGVYYLKAKSISEKINYKKGIIKSLIYYGDYMSAAGKSDSNMYLNQRALELAKEIKDTLLMGISILNIGAALQRLTRPEEALSYLLEGKRLIEKNSDPKNRQVIMQLYNALQGHYFSRAEYDKAIMYGEQALQLARQMNIPYFLTQILLDLSIPYRHKKNYSKAEKLATEALTIAKQTNDKRMQAEALLGLANIFERLGAYNKIMPFAKESLKLIRESGAIDLEPISLVTIATGYLQEKNYREAELYAKQSLELGRKNQSKIQEYAALRILSRIAYASGQTNEAATFDRDAENILADYVRETTSQQSSNLEKKYETEKKNNEIIQLKKDRKIKAQWNYILIGALATLLIISLLSYRTYQQKQKLQKQQIADLEKEKLLLATQSILKGQEEERSRLAKDLHDGLGGMLSGVKLQLGAMKGNLILSEEHGRTFNNALGKLDESISEMRRVAHNMMPEALMKLGLQQALQDYCDSLSESQPFQINCEFHALENRMPSSTEIVVYRIVQELLNNAVKHSGATTILAQVIRHGDNLSITVEDNGKGFDISQTDITKGAGLSNVKARVDYLKGQMDIQSNAGKGTSIHIDCKIDGNG